MLKAMFQVQKVARTIYGGAIEVTLAPQRDTTIKDGERLMVPDGTIQIYVDNPEAVKFFELGKFFYVHFTEVSAATPAK